MQNVLICLTGGTFGSKTSKKGVRDVSKDAHKWFVETVEETYKNQVNFTFLHTTMMLSENMHPEIWETITGDINEVFQYNQNFDGMIVIHGSDTAVYTTSFLGHYYKRLPIPIVVTAANAPIREFKSNGLSNFEASLDFITKEKRLGTFFVYQRNGNRGDIIVYPSDEVIGASPYIDEFESTTPEPYGIMQDRAFLGQPDQRELVKNPTWRFGAFSYQKRIMGVVPYLGLDYSVFNLENISAVVHGAFHSNTYNTISGRTVDVLPNYVEYSLIPFIKKCEGLGVDVYLADFPVNRMDLPMYDSTKILLEHGANIISVPMENAFAKAVYAYNQKEKDAKQVMLDE